MFQFPWCTSTHLWIQYVSNTPLRVLGFPIRKPPDHSLLTAPRGISVFAPSFIGTWRQGILRAPFVA